VIKRGRMDEDAETRVARAASIGMAGIAMAATLAIGSGFNVSILVSMAFVFAASANFPTLLFALTWRRFNTTGALTGVAFGCIASVVMIGLSPPVWPGPDSEGSPSPFIFPGLVTIPIGFIGCWLGTVLSKEETGAERTYDELLVRSETGLGSERGGRFRREGAPAAAAH
jgi:cation/acetate symporter